MSTTEEPTPEPEAEKSLSQETETEFDPGTGTQISHAEQTEITKDAPAEEAAPEAADE